MPLAQSTGGDLCPRCGKVVYFAEASFALGGKFHRKCLKCLNCGKALDSANCNDHRGEVFCNACYRKKFGPKGYGYACGAAGLTTDAIISSSKDEPSMTKGQEERIVPVSVSTGDLCPTCSRTVHAAEKVVHNGTAYHRNCLQCVECSCAPDSVILSQNRDEICCEVCYDRLLVSKNWETSDPYEPCRPSVFPGPPPNTPAFLHSPPPPSPSPSLLPPPPPFPPPTSSLTSAPTFLPTSPPCHHPVSGSSPPPCHSVSGSSPPPCHHPVSGSSPPPCHHPVSGSSPPPCHPVSDSSPPPCHPVSGFSSPPCHPVYGSSPPPCHISGSSPPPCHYPASGPSPPCHHPVCGSPPSHHVCGPSSPCHLVTGPSPPCHHVCGPSSPCHLATSPSPPPCHHLASVPSPPPVSAAMDNGKTTVNMHGDTSPGIGRVCDETEICKRCSKVVFFAERFVAMEQVYHKDCYNCRNCSKSLHSTTIHMFEDEIYCKACYVRYLGPKGYRFGATVAYMP